jgi:flagellar biosynthesis/type III secretory pathway M-ring protein FliF/YscJ
MGGTGNLPIGPGVWGFLALFVLAIALWFLVRNMNARLRRMAYKERERLDAEQARQAPAEQRSPDDSNGGAESPESSEQG